MRFSARHAADAVVRDIRFAARVLAKTPGFTATAALTLAVAIGVNAAVFSLVNAVLLAPLPYPDPDGLALVSRTVRRGADVSSAPAVDGRTWELVRDRAPGVGRAPFSTWTTGVNLVVPGTNGSESAHFVQQQRVGAGFFSVLGTQPQLGRELSDEEDRPGGPAAVVLSAGLWRSAFAADPGTVGRSIVLRGEPYIVVGIMPDGFESGEKADLWTALRPSRTGEGGGENYQVLVRLTPATRAQAAGVLSALGADLARETPPPDGVQISFSLIPLQQGVTAGLRQPVLLLWGAVAIVLVAASVNLAGLMLARAGSRTREIATRLALGSGRSAIVRQLLVEAVLVGLAGGLGGIAVAALAIDGLVQLASGTYDLWQPVSLGSSGVAAALTLSIAASAIFGVGPALYASRSSGVPGPAGGNRSIAGTSSRWPRRALVVTQVALGAMLLVGAGLLLRTFTHLRALDPGFDTRGVVAASISLEDGRYRTVDRVARLAEASLLRLQQTPGIDSAALSLGLPYQRLLNLSFRYADGPEASSASDRAPRSQMTSATYITSGYFDALRIPLRAGRAFDDRDRAGSLPVVVVNDSFARSYFGGADAIGRRIRMSGDERTIVGVVGDVQLKPGWGDRGPLAAMPLAYLPLGQINDAFARLVHGWFMPAFVVRSSLAPASTSMAIREAIDAVDPLMPLASVKTMAEVQAAPLSEQRLLMILLLALAGAAVAVAAMGIHALIAASVTERTREMGIRVALGATAGQALRTLAVPGIALAVTGTAVGLFGAVWLTRTIRSFVWGVSLTDPVTFAAVGVLLGLVAAAASFLPALRILRLDPAVTLRAD